MDDNPWGRPLRDRAELLEILSLVLDLVRPEATGLTYRLVGTGAALARFFHQDGNYSGCPGGAAPHYDLSLWPTHFDPQPSEGFVMKAGSANKITEFDKWMLRDFWRHLKDRYGL